ncbi:MAG TPA: hypothetical protein PLI98_04950 [Candidatus Hydrogenedentes bacterium]|nr:hypothetical protein [Candidatus Hydrogenedentota bacterium]
MRHALLAWSAAVLAGVAAAGWTAAEETTSPQWDVFRGEMIAYPGPWSFGLPKAHIILVSDEQLEALSDPDRTVDISLTFDKREESLRQVCERAQASGARTLIIAFDHFFSQYREGQKGKPRLLTPDKQEYIDRIAAISRFAADYGLGLELSLLSPLEIGPGYAEQTGEQGMWMHYRKGLRDPKSGAYSVQLWRQRRWANNKGPLDVQDARVRVFAFRERDVHGTPYSVVNPADIVEITETANVEVFEDLVEGRGDYQAVRVRVHGTGKGDGRNRVLVVQQYHTPEMDYFSQNALPYLKALGDRYADAGVRLNALYSDEMHIQQDWGYFSHHDHGEFALRYVSPGLARRYAELYGAEYADFAKYLVYFVHGQDDTANDLRAKADRMNVFGASPEDIARTALFRSRYYRLLQDGVVELFTAAKGHLESRMGHRLETRAHATWAESPTIDRWDTGRLPHPQAQYEYTPNFVWSCTVHQAASACHDYFRWGDYLTGNGNDHPEGGWMDRNYYALSLACSTGILNEVPHSYCAHWGMPGPVAAHRNALVSVTGTGGPDFYSMVADMEHRDTSVLMLYPLDLVAASERFGSWMTQYGYANYVTQAKLLEMGRVENGAIVLGGRRFTTLCTLFEPFPAPRLLEMMSALAEQGGRVLWSGPPPLLDADGNAALAAWQALFGAQVAPENAGGLMLPGRMATFSGALQGVPDMPVLTHFLVDRVYPAAPAEGVEPVAHVCSWCAGTLRRLPSGGMLGFLGFRPRDDQAASLGYETRTWFEILDRLGAYPPSGAFPGVNDNPDHLSRTGPHLVCRFPNGAVGVAPHLTSVLEDWPGGFARKAEEDDEIMKRVVLPPDRVVLQDAAVNGQKVSYQGRMAVLWRARGDGFLEAFSGMDCGQITVNGKTTVFAEAPMPLVSWAPVPSQRQVPDGAKLVVFFQGAGVLRIPVAASMGLAGEACSQGPLLGSRGAPIPVTLNSETLEITASPETAGRWIYVR